MLINLLIWKKCIDKQLQSSNETIFQIKISINIEKLRGRIYRRTTLEKHPHEATTSRLIRKLDCDFIYKTDE